MNAKKTSALKEMFRLFDDAASGWGVACHKGCSHCCTSHVTMTTLEGRLLAECAHERGVEHLLDAFDARNLHVFEPAATTNALARMAMERKEPPQESKPDQVRPCPLLEDGVCLLYEARPLACRVMFSRTPCRPDGWADMDEYWITVNQVFLQAVEALDSPGLFGAMAHVMAHLRSGKRHESLLETLPVPGLPVPQEHQHQIAPIVNQLSGILSGAKM